MSSHIISSPIGNLRITTNECKLIQITFTSESVTIEHKPTPYCKSIIDELQKYFHNPHHRFKIKYELTGTDFQKKVWHTLQTIPAGMTITYGELARQLNTSARAIGQACRTNPVPVVVPCHRVVGKNSVGGFVGETVGEQVDIKQKLLKHEQGASAG